MEKVSIHVTELSTIIQTLSSKEKKAVRNFISQHYTESKELQLFQILTQDKIKKDSTRLRKIESLGQGINSVESIIKIKSRVKEKILDYFCSSLSLNQLKNEELSLYRQEKIRKQILQINILIERKLDEQAIDMMNRSLKFAIDCEAINELIQLLKLRRKIHHEFSIPILDKVSANFETSVLDLRNMIDSLSIEATDESEIANKTHNIITNFTKLKEIMPATFHFVKLLSDFLLIPPLKTRDRITQCIILVRHVQANGDILNSDIATFSMHKLGYHLCLLNHPRLALKLVSSSKIITKLKNGCLRILFMIFENSIKNQDLKTVSQVYFVIETNFRSLIYHNTTIRLGKIYLRYMEGDLKLTLNEIQRFRSEHFLDINYEVELRIIEALCLMKLEYFDLLEMRLECLYKLLRRNNFREDNGHYTAYRLLKSLYYNNTEQDDILVERLMPFIEYSSLAHSMSHHFILEELKLKKHKLHIPLIERLSITELTS